jgi:hypothetical protein
MRRGSLRAGAAKSEEVQVRMSREPRDVTIVRPFLKIVTGNTARIKPAILPATLARNWG